MKKSKILMEAHNNGLGHCSDKKELEDLCPLEVMLVSKVIHLCSLLVKCKVDNRRTKRAVCCSTSRF